jgi:hypothetical protein
MKHTALIEIDSDASPEEIENEINASTIAGGTVKLIHPTENICVGDTVASISNVSRYKTQLVKRTVVGLTEYESQGIIAILSPHNAVRPLMQSQLVRYPSLLPANSKAKGL